VAYDVELAERLRLLLADEGAGSDVSEQRMFGGLAFLVGGNMSVAASAQGGLLVRVDPGAIAALLGEPGAEEFEMRGRRMAGWLRVRRDALDDDEVLRTWVRRGVAYARTLPPKGGQ
jgi:TfoX/Sxy family transcriptional regulator of competence genes